MNIPILFENNDLLVINKPSGLVVHVDGRHDEPSVAEWFAERYPESAHVGEAMVISHGGENIDINRAGIVHRIDRDTSGCLVIAKNQAAFENLKEQFKSHTIKKKYVAVIYGWLRDERGIIDRPIGRSASDIRAWTTANKARGEMRPAITRFAVRRNFQIESAPSFAETPAGKEKYSIVDLYPQTGRTHQLRVHLASLDHPIVGDPIYSGSRQTSLPVERTMLHAEKITFSDVNGKPIEVSAPMPEVFETILKRI